MIEFALVPALTSLLIAAIGPRLARALPGRSATLLLPAVALTCALSNWLVLGALGCLALAQWAPLAVLGHWSATALASRDPVDTPVAIGCGCVALVLLMASGVQAVRSVLGFASSARLCARLAVEYPGELIVLDTPAPEAYALAGRPGRTVVSRAMLCSLTGPQRRALLAHESAHLRHHHFVHVHLTRLAAAANPLLARLVPATELAAERWADHEAVVAVGDPRLVARTLARASLLCHNSAHTATGPARGRTELPTLAALGSSVGARIEALLSPPAGPRARTLATVTLLGAAAACIASSGVVGLDLHSLVAWAHTISPGRR